MNERDETLPIADRAYLLAREHISWLQAEHYYTVCNDDTDSEVDCDDYIDSVHYGYLSSHVSPLYTVELFADELDPETRHYTQAFFTATYNAIQKVLTE